MGIDRPHDPYGMSAPPAWVEIDEDILGAYAAAFQSASETVSVQIGQVRGERSEVFDGAAIWSGGAALAALGKVDDVIKELKTRQAELYACSELFAASREAVENAKNTIVGNVNKANAAIDDIKDNNDIEDKDAAIEKIINLTRAANIAVIKSEAKLVSASPVILQSKKANSSQTQSASGNVLAVRSIAALRS